MRRLLIFLLFIPSVATGAVSYVASGTESGVQGPTDCAPGVPAGIANNDILIVVQHSRQTGTAHTCVTNCTGWTNFSAGSDASGGRLTAWWKRTSGTESDPTFDGGATESIACRMFAFRGAVTTGDPWDVLGTNNAEATTATPNRYVSDVLVSTVDNVLTVYLGGSMDNDIWGPADSEAEADGCDHPTAADTNCTTQNKCVDNGQGADDSVFLAHDTTSINAAGNNFQCSNAKNLGIDAGRELILLLKPSIASCTDFDSSMMGVGACY